MTTSDSHLSHPKYRPDIDGLRAIAVLSVVMFHAFPDWMRGGFTGVDVFFVISGFLISTILFENLDKGTFRFATFYARRIKRIFPALFIVLITSYALGWFVLLADEYKQLGKHIAAGSGFVSNFVLWSEAGYFDNSAETKPLLHLWSLGIEEQFYIIWPLLTWFFWKRKFNTLTFIVVIAVVSLVLNLIGVKNDSVAAFYSPQTRFWELLCGSVLAWLSLNKKSAFASELQKLDGLLTRIIFRGKVEANGQTLLNLLSWFGLVLLVYGFWRINKQLSFPGKWALIPVFGAMLIILAGPEAWLNRKFLSNRLAVWFGLISFPLYLWHWPLLSFARIVESEVPDQKIRVAAVALSIVLAWLTYKLVERPVRLSKQGNGKVMGLLLLIATIGFVGYSTYSRDGLKSRRVTQVNASITSGFDGGDLGNMINECGIKDDAIRSLFRMCAKDKRDHVRFALMGDSKAEALYTGLVRTSNADGRWLFIGGNGPHGAPVPLLSSDADPQRPLTHYAIEAITHNDEIETVVLVTAARALFGISDGVKGGNLATYDYTYFRQLSSSKRFGDVSTELSRVVSKFVAKGKRVVLVVDNPALPNPSDCINRKTLLKQGKFNEDCSLDANVFNEQIKLYKRLLEDIKLAHPDFVQIFDPTDIYCDQTSGLCEAIKNERLMYAYTDHISDYAAGLVGRRLNHVLTAR